jgi:serine/threonine-protein kinase HipA
MSQCEAFGLLTEQAAAEVARVVEVVNGWQAHFAQQGVTARDLRSLAERIDGQALREQRLGFEAARYESVPARKVRKVRPGPFKRG